MTDEPEIEKKVLGQRPYHHPLAVVQDDGRTFQIVPRSLPIVGYLYYLGFICLFAVFGSWMIEQHEEQDGVWKHALVWTFFGGIGLLVVGLWGWYQSREIKLGPWLVYDRTSQTILLPRLGESFPRRELLRLQNVTGYSAADVVSKEREQHSELILVTRRGEEIQRRTILASNVTHWAFGKFLDPLVEALELPVVRIKEGLFSGEFEVQDYVPKSRRT